MMQTNWQRLLLATACAAATWPAAGQAPQPAGSDVNIPRQSTDTIVVDPNLFPRPPVPNVIFYRSPDQPADALKAQVVTVHETGTHWIGVGCSPATETLRSQLKLDTGVGLVVDHVVPGSPADKAGLKVHDLLLKIQHGEKSIVLKHLADLSTAVSHVKTDEMQIELLRAGERQTVSVTPMERPETVSFVAVAPPVRFLPSDSVEYEIGQQGTTIASGGGPGHLTIVTTPALRLPEHQYAGAPARVKISAAGNGEGPLNVAVTRAGRTIQATETNLSELPEDLRAPVADLLRQQRGAESGVATTSQSLTFAGAGGVYRLNVAGPAFAYSHVRKFGGLPEGVTVSITRTGNEPAKVTVKRGEQSWETTENDLSVLPEDLRGPVNEMLQHPPHPVTVSSPVITGTAIGIPGPPSLPQSVKLPYPVAPGVDGPGPGALPPQSPVPPQVFRIEKVVPGQPQKVQKEALQQSREALEREMNARLEKLQKLQLQEQKMQLEALNKKLEALQQAVEKLQAPPAEKPQPKE